MASGGDIEQDFCSSQKGKGTNCALALRCKRVMSVEESFALPWKGDA